MPPATVTADLRPPSMPPPAPSAAFSQAATAPPRPTVTPLRPQPAADSDDGDDDEAAGTGACKDYRLDMKAARFGDCVCGFPKADHKNLTRGPGGRAVASRTPPFGAAKPPVDAKPKVADAEAKAKAAAEAEASAVFGAEEWVEASRLEAELAELLAEKHRLEERKGAVEADVARLQKEQILAEPERQARRKALESEMAALHAAVELLTVGA